MSSHVGPHTRWASWGVLFLAAAAVFSITVAVDAGPARAGTPVPGAAGCPMFPSDNLGGLAVTNVPVSPYPGMRICGGWVTIASLHVVFPL